MFSSKYTSQTVGQKFPLTLVADVFVAWSKNCKNESSKKWNYQTKCLNCQ